jgi:hypothetical protein
VPVKRDPDAGPRRVADVYSPSACIADASAG